MEKLEKLRKNSKIFNSMQIEMNIPIEMYLQYIAKLFKLLLRCNKMITLRTDESIKTQKTLPYVTVN